MPHEPGASDQVDVTDRLLEMVGRVHEATGLLRDLLDELRQELEEQAGARRGD